MKNVFAMLLWTCCLVCMGCTDGSQETEVVLETTAGVIRVKLYDDTPGHRDNFVKLVKEGYSINSEFIKDILVEEHGNDPGFNIEAAMRSFHMGQGCEDIERRAVERQNETYLRICHLVDLYTFYLWQDIDDEDAYTSPKRTEDMKSILMECTYDMLDYKAWYLGHWHINKRIDRMHFLMHDVEVLIN